MNTPRRRIRLGGAMVELVVVLPVLILISIGVMDYGRVFATSVAVVNAARAGAEWGAQNGSNAVNTAGIQSFAQLDGAEAGTITLSSQRVCRCGATVVGCSTTCGSYGPARVYVEVTATKVVPLLLRYPGIPASITVSRTATFRQQ